MNENDWLHYAYTQICKIKNDNPKCDEIFKKQCLSTYGSKQCKLRFFNDRCLMALKNKEKEGKKNEEKRSQK